MIVGICENNKLIRDYIEEECQKIFSLQKVECKIHTYSNGVEYLKEVKKNEFDMVILDVEMPKMNGIEIKNILKNVGMKTLVLFVTSHTERIKETFGVHVMGFVDKESIKKELPSALLKATEILGGYTKIEGNDSRTIIYIEAERVYSIFYLVNGEKVYVRKSLNYLEGILECAGIFRIHRSYMINAQWIKGIEKEKVYVEWYVDGKKVEKKILPIAQRRRKSVREKYIEYCIKK